MPRRILDHLANIGSKWTPEPNTGCWLWTGGLLPTGYPKFYIRRKMLIGSRAALLLYRGVVPAPGMYVCHHCDTPSCVNPDHLFVGTPSDNQRDMHAKGRRPTAATGRPTCANGHPWTEENTYRLGRSRTCRSCNRAAASRRKARLRAMTVCK